MMEDADSKRLQDARDYWDNEALLFDNEPDHGLTDTAVLAAWTALVRSWQPTPPAKILDIGCGTGSLSVVLARLGHQVTGIDLSPKMIAQAVKKAARANLDIRFQVMEATNPQFASQQFNGIVCRHLLWALPNLQEVLQNWLNLLQPGGRLLLIEGRWSTGGGLQSKEIVAALPPSLQQVSVMELSHDARFWGKEVDDERYAIMVELS